MNPDNKVVNAPQQQPGLNSMGVSIPPNNVVVQSMASMSSKCCNIRAASTIQNSARKVF